MFMSRNTYQLNCFTFVDYSLLTIELSMALSILYFRLEKGQHLVYFHFTWH